MKNITSLFGLVAAVALRNRHRRRHCQQLPINWTHRRRDHQLHGFHSLFPRRNRRRIASYRQCVLRYLPSTIKVFNRLKDRLYLYATLRTN